MPAIFTLDQNFCLQERFQASVPLAVMCQAVFAGARRLVCPFPSIASPPRRKMLAVRRKRLMAEFSAACRGFLLALFRAARMCRSLCRFLPLRKARIRRGALFRGNEASFAIAHQIHAPSLPERPQNQRAVFGPGSRQQLSLTHI